MSFKLIGLLAFVGSLVSQTASKTESSLIQLDASAVETVVSDARCSAVGVQVGTFKTGSVVGSLGRLAEGSTIASADERVSSEYRRGAAAVGSRGAFRCGEHVVTEADGSLASIAEGTEARDTTARVSSESEKRERAGSSEEKIRRAPGDGPDSRTGEAFEGSGRLGWPENMAAAGLGRLGDGCLT